MDDDLRRALRAYREAPHDPELAAELASVASRAGDLLLALAAARGAGDDAYTEAAARLGASLGLELVRLQPSATYRRGAQALVLVPGGAFLDEGDEAWASSLEPGGSRAPLRRVDVPAFLIARWPVYARSWTEARDQARAAGGRLPTPAEWKKAWRGGLYLDGDLSAQVMNEEPDRLRPSGIADQPRQSLERSPVSGLVYPLFDGAGEWCSERGRLVALASGGRYRLPSEGVRAAGYRLVLEITPGPASQGPAPT